MIAPKQKHAATTNSIPSCDKVKSTAQKLQQSLKRKKPTNRNSTRSRISSHGSLQCEEECGSVILPLFVCEETSDVPLIESNRIELTAAKTIQ
mmetsp:Transcript_3404/g.9544  ORF Transcript_3404/g.9544 Transcript_3404/m.9544 type:complete len:93 (+) Transcript_3404:2170-2448(+)